MAEKKYYSEKIMNCEDDFMKTWAVVRTSLQKTSNSITTDLFIIKGIEIHDQKTTTSKFKDYLTNIGANLASKIQKSTKPIIIFFKCHQLLRLVLL